MQTTFIGSGLTKSSTVLKIDTAGAGSYFPVAQPTIESGWVWALSFGNPLSAPSEMTTNTIETRQERPLRGDGKGIFRVHVIGNSGN